MAPFSWRVALTCLSFGRGNRPFNVHKDGVDGDGVLCASMQALHHVEIKVVSQVYVFYVSLCGNREVDMCMCIYVFK